MRPSEAPHLSTRGDVESRFRQNPPKSFRIYMFGATRRALIHPFWASRYASLCSLQLSGDARCSFDCDLFALRPFCSPLPDQATLACEFVTASLLRTLSPFTVSVFGQFPTRRQVKPVRPRHDREARSRSNQGKFLVCLHLFGTRYITHEMLRKSKGKNNAASYALRFSQSLLVRPYA